MHHWLLPATAASTPPVDTATPNGLNGAVVLLIVGMGVVFVSLALLMVLVRTLRALADAQRIASPDAVLASTAADPPSGAPAAVAVTPDALDPRLVAVLTAAATAALGQRVHIAGISPAPSAVRVGRYANPDGAAWRRQGTRDLMTGHRRRSGR